MSEINPSPAEDEPGLYEICIRGCLTDQWAAWFEGLTIMRREDGTTLLTGLVTDQAALYGLLRKVRDLGMPLLTVKRVKSDPAAAPSVKT